MSECEITHQIISTQSFCGSRGGFTVYSGLSATWKTWKNGVFIQKVILTVSQDQAPVDRGFNHYATVINVDIINGSSSHN